MARYFESFVNTMSEFQLTTLETDPSSIYVLDADLLLSYLNPGWFVFANDNDGEPDISDRFGIGTPLALAISEPLKEYYIQAFQVVLDNAKVWSHVYECSSPQLYRIFHLSAYPLHNRAGLIVVNSLVKEQPHDPQTRPPASPDKQTYTNSSGLIVQCSNCRRTQTPWQPGRWDWVPAWVEQPPPEVSHGLCRLCFEFYSRDPRRVLTPKH